MANRYLSSAFKLQYNLILLGGSALLSLASASPVPLLLGLAAELLWLALAPNLPAFRAWVDRRPAPEPASSHRVSGSFQPPSSSFAPPPSSLSPLDAQHAGRLVALERAISEVRALGFESGDAEFERAAQKLEQLLPQFRRLSQQHQRLLRYLDEVKKPELEAEIAELGKAFAAEQDLGLRMSLRQARTVAERRLEQRARIAATSRAAEIKLQTIERSIGACRGLGLVSSRDLGVEADAIVAQLGNLAQALELESDALGRASGM